MQAVLDLPPSTTLKQFRSFLGLMQFYRGIWKCRSRVLSPLIDLVGVSKKIFKWTKVLQQTIEDIKKAMEKKPYSLTQISIKYLRSMRIPAASNWLRSSPTAESPYRSFV